MKLFAQITRPWALLLITLIWAGIYLPALGTLEIKGEEGRRILPGLTMLETGNWIVPQVGGVDYFSKPPLINWAIAAAVRGSGRQDEWAARTPSVLCVWALGTGTVWLLAEWLGAGGALLAAIFMLTGIGLMEKGRLAEIEAMYISLSGLAVVAWLSFWRGRRSRWATWTVPWVFLGLGLLTKGPLHLVFFYGIVAGTLVAARRWRELFGWPHLAGVVLMLAIFGAWAVPYVHLTAAERVGAVWSRQLASRLEVDDEFQRGKWALNGPRGLVNFVPWVVLVPLLWRRRTAAEPVVDPGAAADLAIVRGGRWGLAACFLAVSLAPGSLPRYTLPLLVPASVLLAVVCSRPEVFGELPEWLPASWAAVLVGACLVSGGGAGLAAQAGGGGWRWGVAGGVALASGGLLVGVRRLRGGGAGRLPALGVLSAGVMVLTTFDYALGGVPRLLAKERLRPLCVRLNALTADGPPIYVYQPGFLPVAFYLHPAARYNQKIENLPASARYLLVYAKDYPVVSKQLQTAGFSMEPTLTFALSNRGSWHLLRLRHA